jgi:electron transport complex protein RnfD
MRNVLIALLPVSVFAVYAFGMAAALVLTVATISCVATEHLLCRATVQASTTGDWSVSITGLLYGLTLPPDLPLWMVAIGGVFGVAVGKFLFGGLGSNAFNPALVGRAFLQAAFPQAMTHWSPSLGEARFLELPSSTLALPFTQPVYDAVTTATPLAMMKFQAASTDTGDLLLGLTSGSTGETCAVLILLGGIYLVARNMMNWRTPISIFATVVLITWAFNWWSPGSYGTPEFMLFSGGLMLGAVFMATDMVASPITNAGCWLYGFLIGALVVVIRFWGGMPEGVMYAILLANAVSPHIDRLIQPVLFGARKEPQ